MADMYRCQYTQGGQSKQAYVVFSTPPTGSPIDETRIAIEALPGTTIEIKELLLIELDEVIVIP